MVDNKITVEYGRYYYNDNLMQEVSRREAICHDFDLETTISDYPYATWKVYSKDDEILIVGDTMKGSVFLRNKNRISSKNYIPRNEKHLKIIFLDVFSRKTFGIYELRVDKLNSFEGADIGETQVLKSAAGYYIGALEQMSGQLDYWIPSIRNSAHYFKTRQDAEMALITGNYPVKF